MPKSSPTKPDDRPAEPLPKPSSPPTSSAPVITDTIRTAIQTVASDPQPDADPAPSIPALLDRVSELESALAALLDDLAVAIPDLRAPSPLPASSIAPSGAYALQPAPSALDTLRERAATGDRAALMRYLRLRRS